MPADPKTLPAARGGAFDNTAPGVIASAAPAWSNTPPSVIASAAPAWDNTPAEAVALQALHVQTESGANIQMEDGSNLVIPLSQHSV